MEAGNLPTAVFKLHAIPPDHFPSLAKPSARFAVSQSTWVVRTESNVRKEEKRRPEPSCVVCSGSGRTDCRFCCGRGRTNCVEQVMLPKGEWPKWCRICGGSGLDYCPRCLGTGEHRDTMGFHFMRIDPTAGGCMICNLFMVMLIDAVLMGAGGGRGDDEIHVCQSTDFSVMLLMNPDRF